MLDVAADDLAHLTDLDGIGPYLVDVPQIAAQGFGAERGRRHQLVFLSPDDAFDIRGPPRLLHGFFANAFPVGDVLVLPYVHDAIQFPDLNTEKTDNARDFLPPLENFAEFLDVLGNLMGPTRVDAHFVQHLRFPPELARFHGKKP
jgi:hypothetical protein